MLCKSWPGHHQAAGPVCLQAAWIDWAVLGVQSGLWRGHSLPSQPPQADFEAAHVSAIWLLGLAASTHTQTPSGIQRHGFAELCCRCSSAASFRIQGSLFSSSSIPDLACP